MSGVDSCNTLKIPEILSALDLADYGSQKFGTPPSLSPSKLGKIKDGWHRQH